jgi:hypothetical protein
MVVFVVFRKNKPRFNFDFALHPALANCRQERSSCLASLKIWKVREEGVAGEIPPALIS